MRGLKIGIGSDHAGFVFKEAIKEKLLIEGYEIVDVGTHDEHPVATAPYLQAVAEGLLSGDFEKGILICGTGGGMSISANRYRVSGQYSVLILLLLVWLAVITMPMF